MNETSSQALVTFICVLLAVSPCLGADDTLRGQTLKLFPQADANGDGVLSDTEEAALSRQALKRYPQADQNGDGVLSDTEKRALLKLAAKRATRKSGGSTKAKANQNDRPDAEGFLRKLGLRAERNIEYRTNTAQQRNKLDFIYPKKKVYEKAPLFIYIHGGGNTGGSKISVYKQGNLIVKELTEAGIAVASIDYRLFGRGEELGFQHLFQDCKDALRFLAKNADRFGIDPHKIVTWGTSAGGSKSLIAALTPHDFLPGEVTGPGTEHTVVGAISLYGATTYVADDAWNKRRNRTKANLIFRSNSGLSLDEIRRMLSADQHIDGNSPPILLVHGDSDPTVPVDVSRHLYQVGKDKGANVSYTEVKNAAHMLKAAKGSSAPPSMTWDEAQQLVIKQTLEWVK